MKILVTGANGMLGQAVVAEACRRGHEVRALVRPAARIEALGWDPSIDVVRADLRSSTDLVAAFDDVDVLVHLAAAVTGGEDLQFASTVRGTERLLEAMTQSHTKALVLVSSLSVYDWSKVQRELAEHSPLEADVYNRDGYAIAKIWQERLARRFSAKQGWRLTVLRPGFIWGRQNAMVSGIGQVVGPAFVVVAPRALPPLTHVANCADATLTATEMPAASGETFNIVDEHGVSSWHYAKCYMRYTGRQRFRFPVPYALGVSLVYIAHATSKAMFRGKGKLPSVLVPRRFEARFKPVSCSHHKLRSILGWSPPFSFEECLRLTYGPPVAVHSLSEQHIFR